MGAVDFLATQPAYVGHLTGIWHALAAELRGTFWTRPDLHHQLSLAGVGGDAIRYGRPRPAHRLTVVAGAADSMSIPHRPVVLINHGAGQTYDADPRTYRNPSYSGGIKRENVVLFLGPSDLDGLRNLQHYPHAEAVTIGTPVYLDSRFANLEPRKQSRPPTVAISFHWPGRLCPEIGWAWHEYADTIARLAARTDLPYRLIGHGHPRAWPTLASWWESIGVEPVEHLVDVAARADLYVIDNSSSGYELAALGIPTLWLNPRSYRRDVHHGLRFWDQIPGLQVDHPDDLEPLIDRALEDAEDVQVIRERVIGRVYGWRDGRSAQRAATAITDVVGRLDKLWRPTMRPIRTR